MNLWIDAPIFCSTNFVHAARGDDSSKDVNLCLSTRLTPAPQQLQGQVGPSAAQMFRYDHDLGDAMLLQERFNFSARVQISYIPSDT